MSDKKAPRGTVKKLLRALRPYRGRLLFSLLCSAVNAGLSLYIPLLFGRCIDLIVGPHNVDTQGVKNKLMLSGALILISALGAYLAAAENNRVTQSVIRDLRNGAFRKIQILPLSYLDSHPSGDTLSRVVNDVDRFADGLLLGFTQFFSGVITIVGDAVGAQVAQQLRDADDVHGADGRAGDEAARIEREERRVRVLAVGGQEDRVVALEAVQGEGLVDDDAEDVQRTGRQDDGDELADGVGLVEGFEGNEPQKRGNGESGEHGGLRRGKGCGGAGGWRPALRH